MPAKIHDQFTALPCSPQRKFQLRQATRGLCKYCARSAVPGADCCQTHGIARRLYARRVTQSEPSTSGRGRPMKYACDTVRV